MILCDKHAACACWHGQPSMGVPVEDQQSEMQWMISEHVLEGRPHCLAARESQNRSSHQHALMDVACNVVV